MDHDSTRLNADNPDRSHHDALTQSYFSMFGLHGNSSPSPANNHHSIVWIDGVGGYLLWDKPELVIGQAFAEARCDVGIVGDISRQAISIRRMESDYLLQPLQATKLNGVTIDRSQLLKDNALIEIGNSVKVRFRRPNTLSGTCRLEMVSIHRWKPTVDAIIMLADCCIMGPKPGSHIQCAEWNQKRS